MIEEKKVVRFNPHEQKPRALLDIWPLMSNDYPNFDLNVPFDFVLPDTR